MKAIISIGVIAVLSIALTSFKKKEETGDFLILIQDYEESLKLTCEAGCAWTDLAFTLKSGEFQAVDQYGMTTANREPRTKDNSLANFLINVQRTNAGINLEGKEGTAWTKLSFSCLDNICNQYIDRKGMTNK